MPSKKSHAFSIWILCLALIALLGVALLAYGSATWKPAITTSLPALLSRWEAVCRV